MYHKRKYKPINPEKYDGDPTNIICRSSWEIRFASWCDKNPSVLSWKSEEVIIPYVCPTDNRVHRYFVDFMVKVKTKSGATRSYLVEIKPYMQTLPPKYPGKRTKRYLTESLTFMKNQAKWEAARNYCKTRDVEFLIITEHELGLTNK